MWRVTDDGIREFLGGCEEWLTAARIAAGCRLFCPDAEEEQVADEGRSCYNCHYRRWTTASFVCMAPDTAEP